MIRRAAQWQLLVRKRDKHFGNNCSTMGSFIHLPNLSQGSTMGQFVCYCMWIGGEQDWPSLTPRYLYSGLQYGGQISLFCWASPVLVTGKWGRWWGAYGELTCLPGSKNWISKEQGYSGGDSASSPPPPEFQKKGWTRGGNQRMWGMGKSGSEQANGISVGKEGRRRTCPRHTLGAGIVPVVPRTEFLSFFVMRDYKRKSRPRPM